MIVRDVAPRPVEPPLGTHLRSPRPRGYSHHGIYEGFGWVIHFAGDHPGEKATARVRRTSVAEFADGHSVFIVQHKSARFSGEEIVARAHANLGKAGYAFLFHNCEHFARWCVTDKAESHQVQLGAVGAAALGWMWLSTSSAKARRKPTRRVRTKTKRKR